MLDTAEILDLVRKTFSLVLQLSLPYLLVSMIIGLVLAIFAAATQIHEQTVSFVVKLLCVIVMIGVMGSTMLATLQDFFVEIMGRIAGG